MAAHDFAQAPPDTIAHHRVAERFFDAEAEAAQRQGVGAEKNGEMCARAALSGAIDGVEFPAAHDARLARKAQAARATRA